LHTIPPFDVVTFVARISREYRDFVATVDEPLRDLCNMSLYTAGLRWILWRYLKDLH
jgi:hypothetical protein